MSKRIPLLLTLLPLLVGLVGYFLWWQGKRDAFAADLRRAMGSGAAVEVGGFPYRLEADFGRVSLSRVTPLVAVRVSADGLSVNRAPVGRALDVISAIAPIASVRLTGVAASQFSVHAHDGRSSLRFGANDVVARSSSVFNDARVSLAAFATPATAGSFEVHVRETPQALDPASRSPAYPEQAQLVLEGAGVRIGGGDPVRMTAQFGLDAKAPLRGAPAVLDGATLELRKAEIADATGVVATLAATASADRAGAVLVSGTVDTVCPANVAALLEGRAGVREMRQRRPQRLAYSGPPGAVTVSGGITGAPVRSQAPPCPVLRR